MNNQNNLPPVVTVESLKASHGDEGVNLYHEISRTGGFGDFRNSDFVGGCPPLDIKGLPDEVKQTVREILTRPQEPVLKTPPPVNQTPPAQTAVQGENKQS